MGKKKNNNKQNKSDVLVDELNEHKLAKEILYAYELIEYKKKEEEKKLNDEKTKEWKECLGQKEYPTYEKWYKRMWHETLNCIVGLLKLLFIKKKDVNEMRATMFLMSYAIICIFDMCKILLYIMSAFVLYLCWINNLLWFLGITCSILLFILARLFRIAVFEIDKMKDENMLATIFSAALSFVTIVVPVVTFLLNKVM